MSRAMADIELVAGVGCRRGLRPTWNRGFSAASLRHISRMVNDAPNENVPVWGARGIPQQVPSFPRLAATTDADVCVIGLGGSGLACIAELLASGITPARVVGIDAD